VCSVQCSVYWQICTIERCTIAFLLSLLWCVRGLTVLFRSDLCGRLVVVHRKHRRRNATWFVRKEAKETQTAQHRTASCRTDNWVSEWVSWGLSSGLYVSLSFTS
jgi:hypothetical protein